MPMMVVVESLMALPREGVRRMAEGKNQQEGEATHSSPRKINAFRA